jgi:hypothetical protein
MQRLKCDECGSEEVDVFVKPPSRPDPPPPPLAMSEWQTRSRIVAVPLVYHITTTVAQCRSCGHRVERTE